MQTDPLKEFGLRLAQIRKQKGFSQETDISKTGIRKWHCSQA
ncbi:MAG: hypothetical protein Q4C68_00545 [Moraxella sp.]|nr:hypothetical protein [Moraxella sp.]